MTTEYVKKLVLAYPSIKQIWLIGSRANGTARADSDWDYLVFTDDGHVLNALYRDKKRSSPEIDVLLVVDGRHAINPWSVDTWTKSLCLDDLPGNLAWQLISDTEAQYRPRQFSENKQLEAAKRVFPLA